jgi:hypothetical protein
MKAKKIPPNPTAFSQNAGEKKKGSASGGCKRTKTRRGEKGLTNSKFRKIEIFPLRDQIPDDADKAQIRNSDDDAKQEQNPDQRDRVPLPGSESLPQEDQNDDDTNPGLALVVGCHFRKNVLWRGVTEDVQMMRPTAEGPLLEKFNTVGPHGNLT